jgi:hypothetical protein
VIATWMLYCLAVSLLVGVAAAALEGALRLRGLPARWPWLGALAASVVIPATSLLSPGAVRGAGGGAAAQGGTAGDALAGIALVVTPVAEGSQGLLSLLGGRTPRLDGPLFWLWVGSSVALVLFVVVAQWRLARRRRRWTHTRVDGLPVLLSRSVGPAVVGFVRSVVVLPEWVLEAEPSQRQLMLAHEEEHLRAGDPRLLLGALALLTLVAWNPVAWWQARRLRLAVEMDCDARVLRRHPDLHAYGTLLLELGRRGGGGHWAVAAAFSEPVSTLERRIRMMTFRTPRGAALRAALFAGAGGLLVLAACETPAPTQLAPREGAVLYSAADAPAPDRIDTRDHRAAVQQHFPQVLTEGMGVNAALAFVVNAQGEIVEARALPRQAAESSREGRVLVTPDAEGNVMRFSVPRLEEASFKSLDIAPERIRTVEISRMPAGALGPDPVSVIWIRQRAEGEVAAAPRDGEALSEQRVMIRLRAPGEGGEARDVVTVPRSAGDVLVGKDGSVVSPLFIVDGVAKPRGFNPRDAGITPDRIERIEVLKGEAAVRLHGPDAAEGVVSITTKKTAGDSR